MLVVLVVVQPVDHGRVLGQCNQQVSIVRHSQVTEHVDLLEQVVAVINLSVAGREDMVPEQRHLLFQRPLGSYHPIQPVGLSGRCRASGHLSNRMVPIQGVLIDRWLAVRVKQHFHCLLIPNLAIALNLVTSCAETGSTHQVRHQAMSSLVAIRVLLSSCCRRLTPPLHFRFRRQSEAAAGCSWQSGQKP